MRKRLVAGLGLVSLLIAGCGGGIAESPPSETESPSSGPAPTSEAESQRTAPAKSLKLDDDCSVISAEQQQALGIDQPPEARESNGKPGCQYQVGQLASNDGWGFFVSADKSQTMKEFADTAARATETEVAGYPAASAKNSAGCLLVADVSDTGSLLVNVLANPSSDASGSDSCENAEKVVEAAVENLPDA